VPVGIVSPEFMRQTNRGMPVPIPDPSFLDLCVRLKTINGERRWGNTDGNRIYTWDSLHGEIEVYNVRGFHLGVVDAFTGLPVKAAVKGRRIDV
jgi:hypothetical protein